MKDIIINLELTSRCNRKCIVCPQGNPDTGIVRKDMSLDGFKRVLGRIEEAADQGLFVREIINSGYGESVLHREFSAIMDMYKEFGRTYRERYSRDIAVSVVTNGSMLTRNNLEKISGAADILKFSFPSPDPSHYGILMYRDASRGPELLDRAAAGLKRAMEFSRTGKLKELRVHISPPHALSFADFDSTVDYLTQTACTAGLKHIKIVTFPSTSNRGGSIHNRDFINSFYSSHKKKYKNRKKNGVLIEMISELSVFYPRYIDVLSVLKHRFPCLWKGGSISIDSSGRYRVCINDFETHTEMGTVEKHRISEVRIRLERIGETPNCRKCNENPKHMNANFIQKLYNVLSRAAIGFNSLSGCINRGKRPVRTR